MNSTFQEWMRDATRLTRVGQLGNATAAIQRALRRAAAGSPAAEPTAVVLDGCVFERTDQVSARASSREPGRAETPAGEFVDGSHSHAALTRQYKLYVPPDPVGRPLPLVVMLHGCTQGPDDFAAGTGMNALAAEHGFYVLYPGQAHDANPSRCWNWFKHNHQARDRGETAVIASMTMAVIQAHGIDAERVYIAGLSAGGAMASLVAAAYPDVFAAVGVHSGLAPGAARNLPEGLAAMRAGHPEPGLPGMAGLKPESSTPNRRADLAELPVPAIVFHGDQDQTVHPGNGEQVVAAVLRGCLRAAATPHAPVVEHGESSLGLCYTRSTYRYDDGTAVAEHWLVHGAGHAWCGGQPAGSFTDARGPDASREMLRFFLGRSRRRGGRGDEAVTD